MGLAHSMVCPSFTESIDRCWFRRPAPDCVGSGSAHDGGYVVALETISRARRLLSFGVATNWDFERDALALNPALVVEAFDPAVGARRFAEMAARSAISVPLRMVAADPRGAVSSLPSSDAPRSTTFASSPDPPGTLANAFGTTPIGTASPSATSSPTVRDEWWRAGLRKDRHRRRGISDPAVDPR